MIQLNNLSKSFGRSEGQNRLLNDISLSIEKAEWVTFIGPSGSGKTTLLNCISGLLKPDAGTVHYEGADIYRMRDQERGDFRRTHIGFIFQDFKLLPYYSVLDNVKLPLLYDERQSSLTERAKSLLNKVGIPERYFHRLPERLSGGEKQRVAIARALIADPDYLIGDEPTGNLDMENRNQVLDLIAGLQAAGKTIILVTHDQEVADRGNATYRLLSGKLEAREAAR